MKPGFVFAGALLAGASIVPVASHAATSDGIVVADNNGQHDEHKEGGTSKPGTHEHMGGQEMMKGPSTMNMQHTTGGSGPNMMGPEHHMNGPGGQMNGNMMMGHGPSHQNFDKHAYQRNFRAPHQFHFGVYVRPHGWYYRRWGYGDILPALFWTQNYWIGDYVEFGLAVPPPGFVWVRYGNDALLVNMYTGEVLQVEYGLFF